MCKVRPVWHVSLNCNAMWVIIKTFCREREYPFPYSSSRWRNSTGIMGPITTHKVFLGSPVSYQSRSMQLTNPLLEQEGQLQTCRSSIWTSRTIFHLPGHSKMIVWFTWPATTCWSASLTCRLVNLMINESFLCIPNFHKRPAVG